MANGTAPKLDKASRPIHGRTGSQSVDATKLSIPKTRPYNRELLSGTAGQVSETQPATPVTQAGVAGAQIQQPVAVGYQAATTAGQAPTITAATGQVSADAQAQAAQGAIGQQAQAQTGQAAGP